MVSQGTGNSDDRAHPTVEPIAWSNEPYDSAETMKPGLSGKNVPEPSRSESSHCLIRDRQRIPCNADKHPQLLPELSLELLIT